MAAEGATGRYLSNCKAKGSTWRRFFFGLLLHAMATTCLAKAGSKVACSLEPSLASGLCGLSPESSQAKR